MYCDCSKYDEKDEKYFTAKVPLKFRHFFFLDIKQVLLNGRQLNRTNAWITLIFSTGVMSIGTWLLVEGTILLGQTEYWMGSHIANLFNVNAFNGLGIPIIFLSVLIAAAATSIPDTMISIRDARKGNHDDSISNAIGSNIFDISFAIGFPLMLYTMFHGGSITLSQDVQLWSFGILIAMWLINIIVVLIFLPRRLPIRGKATILLSIYILFILFIVLEQNEGLRLIFEKMMLFIQELF